MPRVATFCPRCGESIDTQLPEEAKALGRAELACPACRFRFVIAPAQQPKAGQEPPGELPAASGQAGQEGQAGKRPEDTGNSEPPKRPEDPTEGEQRETDAPSEQPRIATQVEGRPAAGVPQATEVHSMRQGPSGSLPARLLMAGLLLFFAAAIGLFYAIVFANAPGIFQDALEGPDGTGEVEGFVVDPGRDAIEGARVSVMAQVEQGERPDLDTPEVANATTDAEGKFRMEGVDPGVRWVKIEMEGHRTTFFQTWALSSEGGGPGQSDLGSALWEVVLREGEQEDVAYQTQQVSMLEGILRFFQVSGWISFPASVLCAVAGVFILMRRSFAFAVTGSVAGILSVGFLVGAIMALIALIMVLTARREFTPFRKPKQEPDPW